MKKSTCLAIVPEMRFVQRFPKDAPSNPISYEGLRKYFFDQAATLIQAELPVMQATQAAFFEHSKAGEAKVSVEDVTKILNAVKPAEK